MMYWIFMCGGWLNLILAVMPPYDWRNLVQAVVSAMAFGWAYDEGRRNG